MLILKYYQLYSKKSDYNLEKIRYYNYYIIASYLANNILLMLLIPRINVKQCVDFRYAFRIFFFPLYSFVLRFLKNWLF